MKIFKSIFLFCLIPSALFAGTIYDTDLPKTITAPKIEYNIKSETMKTTGKTEVSNTSGQKITLVDSYMSNKGANSSGQDVQLWLGKSVYITADKITRENENTVSRNAVFTACYECDSFGNAWEISTTKLTHNIESHLIRFYNPVFWVYNLPVLWFPFFQIPDPSVKHKTGLLIPDFNSTNNMGTQFNLPVYISFSDTHDATVKLSYLTQENPLFQLEHRLNASHSEFRTSGSFTRNKEGENRWHIFNDDIIEMGDNVRTTIFLERASDKTYLQKYGFYGDQPYLDSGAKVELFGQTGYVVADTHTFQELRTDSTKYSTPSGNILPNIRGVYQTEPLFNQTYINLNTDILGVAGSGTSSQRVIGESSIVSPWTLWGGNRLTANLSARYDFYNFGNTEMIDGENFSGIKTRFLPSGYLEWGLPLVRSGESWKQVIEPRARITTMRNLDDSAFALNNDSAGALLSDATLFSDNRFSGLDLWENGTFSDYGVRWAAFNNNGHNIETFLGQTYDFTKRTDTDPNSGFHNGQSDYVGRIGYENSKWLQLSSRFRFAEDTMSLQHIENSARIGTTRNYFDIGHIWATQFIDALTIDNNINEITSGFGIQLTERIGIKFNAIYNATEERFQRHTGGVFYTHPCYFLSLEYRRDNTIKEDYVGNTTLQFRFGVNIDGKKL
ncbi:MAG: LPS-assembly protein LptD [Alphaproteobacteria bacterium]|nr:LPS-assembly protein LptD [Alphaproteobacteria bacterium]MBN2675309.1 LPS-assembly protein LptD [Alphaproteobacteria bacterium]